MKQVTCGIEIVDVSDSGGWIEYEPMRKGVAKTLNHHMYLLFQDGYHISQFAEDRKFVINVKDDSLEKVIGNARIPKAIVEYGTPLSMNGYEISVPVYARNIAKPPSKATGSIPENTIYTFSDVYHKDMKTGFDFISDLVTRISIEAVDILLGSISFVNKNLLYHYPHYFIIGDSQIKVLNDDYQTGGQTGYSPFYIERMDLI